jgi:acetyltransferase-like isoleucine patch superfamily enzyme
MSMSSDSHQYRVIETDQIGKNVVIHPFTVIRSDVVIGDNVIIHPHVVIESGVTIGSDVEVFPGAYIGKPPRAVGSLIYKPEYVKAVKLGSGSVIGPGAIIYCDVVIGDECLVGDAASIREKCRIADLCIVGRHVTLGPNVLMGKRSRAVDFAHVVGNTVIGEDSFISMHACAANDNYFGTRGYDESFIQGPKIGDRVRVGLAAMLLPGVKIGNDAVVAAGSIVTRDVPAGKMVRGQPARVTGDAQLSG